MTQQLKNFGIILLIVVLGGASIALGISYYLRNNQLNELNQTIDNSGFSVSGDTVNDKLESLIGSLAVKEQELLNTPTSSYGLIQGEILPLVSQDGVILGNQTICAEPVTNIQLTTCVNVSSSSRTFSIPVLNGEYYVFAQLNGSEVSEQLLNQQAYFTQYIACEMNGDTQCNEDLKNRKQKVSVASGEATIGANPTGWVGLNE